MLLKIDDCTKQSYIISFYGKIIIRTMLYYAALKYESLCPIKALLAEIYDDLISGR